MQRFLYRLLRLLSGVRYWIQRHLTKAGLLLFFGLIVTATFGLDTTRSLAYQSFTLLLCLFILAVVGSLRFRPDVSVSRTLPRFVTVGEPFTYALAVRNLARKSLEGLLVREQEADPRPLLSEFLQAPDVSRGSACWSRLIASRKVALFEEVALPALPPHGEVEIRMAGIPLRRGKARLVGVTVARPDPFGLFKAQATVPAEGSFLILPKRYKVPDIQLPGTRKYQPGGVTLASSVADSEEFLSLRDYRPGDPLRHIHWKSWAKAGKPIVKEYQDEFFVRHALVLDTFADATSAESLEGAVSVAASFACSIDTQDSLLDVMFMEDKAYCFTTGRGLGGVERLLEILACIQPCLDKPLSELRDAVLARRASVSGCICVLLAWDGPRQQLVKDLKAAGLPVLVLVITGVAVDNPSERIHVFKASEIAEGLARL